METKYQGSDIFSEIDGILCAEHQKKYVTQANDYKYFYYNSKSGIKLYQGDSLLIMKKIPDKCIDMIFDPFAGSGTTGFVAQGLNRKCIMIEIEPNYCEIIKERCEGRYGEFRRKTSIEGKL